LYKLRGVEASERVLQALANVVELRERIAEVEGDAPQAFEARQKIVRLLVSGVTL
jgi:hypothetical protein